MCDYLQTFKLNALETMYLVTSLFILLAGMAFQSGVTTEGSQPHLALTYLVLVVLVGSVRELACVRGLRACQPRFKVVLNISLL